MDLHEQFLSNKKKERHRTVAETRYWCGQWRLLAASQDTAISFLESALAKAEEAFGFLGEVRYFCTHCCGQEPDLAASGAMAVCKKCGYCMGRIDPRPECVAALTAIREARHD